MAEVPTFRSDVRYRIGAKLERTEPARARQVDA